MGEAATTLGAAPRQRFRTVTFPLLLPSVVTGFVAAFVLSLNEYIIAFMVAGFSVETLPIKIFNSLRYGFTPTIAAVSVVFTLLSVVALGILARFGGLERLLGADLRPPTEADPSPAAQPPDCMRSSGAASARGPGSRPATAGS